LKHLENHVRIRAFADQQFNGYGVIIPAHPKTEMWKNPGHADKTTARNITIITLIEAVLETIKEQKSKNVIVVVSNPRTVFTGLESKVMEKGHEFLLSDHLKNIEKWVM